MKIAICDDDELSLSVLNKHIESTEDIELAEKFTNPLKLVAYLKNNDVDLVILDIEMPEMTGIEILQYVKLPQVVIMSNKKEYAAEAFDHDVTDFLSKPISYARFLKAINKVVNVNKSLKAETGNDGVFFVKDGGKHIKIEIDKINYIEAEGDYVKINTEDSSYMVLSTMKNMENRLNTHNFVRIHRSHIINVSKVTVFEENMVIVRDKTFVVSRNYKATFMGKIKTI